jgi:hypothetical protein
MWGLSPQAFLRKIGPLSPHKGWEGQPTAHPMTLPLNRDAPAQASPPSDAPGADSVRDFSMSELSLKPLQDPLGDHEEPDAGAEAVDPQLLARRRRFRSWVGRGMAGLTLFTLIALLARGVGQRTTSPEIGSPAAANQPGAATAASERAAAPAVLIPERASSVTPAISTPTPALESLRDIELPPKADAAGLARWSRLAGSATAEDFAAVDAELAKLVKTRTASIRERARLARALLWRERGRSPDVQAVFDDLALHAKTRDVRAAARTNRAR